jgi:hypothetical protein
LRETYMEAKNKEKEIKAELERINENIKKQGRTN